MRPSLSSVLPGLIVCFRLTSANLSLPDVQKISGFSKKCTDAYSTNLTYCSSQLVGLGGHDECTDGCDDQISAAGVAIIRACDVYYVDPQTAIGMFLWADARDCLCQTPGCTLHTWGPYTSGTVQTGCALYSTVPAGAATTSACASSAWYLLPGVNLDDVDGAAAALRRRNLDIIGGLAGGFAGIGVLATTVFFILRRKRQQKKVMTEVPLEDAANKEDNEASRRMLDGRPVWRELEQQEQPTWPSDANSNAATSQTHSNERQELDGAGKSRFWPDGVSGGDGFMHELPG